MTGDDGRAGREAARLVSAAQDWLRDAAPHLAPVSSDGEPCSCPLCRAVVALREADADTVGRWVDTAVTGLSAALSQASAAAASAQPSASPQSGDETDEATDTDGDGEDGDDDEGEEPPGRRAVRRIPLDDPAPASEDDRLA